jgi:hypothetical protein
VLFRSDLGPMPEPQITPKEPNPGGVDAIDADDTPPANHDLLPENNPSVEEAVPDEIRQPENTETAATAGKEVDEQEESPA